MSLEGVRPGRCGYCGWPCDGVACACHRDLSVDVPVDEYEKILHVAGFSSTALIPRAEGLYIPPMQAATSGEAVQAREGTGSR